MIDKKFVDTYTISVTDYDLNAADYNVTYSATDYSFSPPEVKCYKVRPEAHLPEYGSELAACFDLKASLKGVESVTMYAPFNTKVSTDDLYSANVITLPPGFRALVPTGIIFDLKQTQSLRIHPRSGLALKQGIVIANCEGVVDADYVEETFVMLTNMSEQPFYITDGDRIAQGEVVTFTKYNIVEIETRPEQKTSRQGGFGSTGK